MALTKNEILQIDLVNLLTYLPTYRNRHKQNDKLSYGLYTGQPAYFWRHNGFQLIVALKND